MSIRKTLTLGAVCSLAVVLPAAPAAADDVSLRAAGKSRDTQFTALGKKTRAAFRAWKRSNYSQPRARRVIRLLRRTRAEIRIVKNAVAKEQPSTDGGSTYKRRLNQSLSYLARALRLNELGVRARTAGKTGRARVRFRQAGRSYELASRYEKAAIRAIEGSWVEKWTTPK